MMLCRSSKLPLLLSLFLKPCNAVISRVVSRFFHSAVSLRKKEPKDKTAVKFFCSEELIDAGMSVARFNFSHGDHEGHKACLDRVRTAAKNKGKHVGESIHLSLYVFVSLESRVWLRGILRSLTTRSRVSFAKSLQTATNFCFCPATLLLVQK